jgi:hypothetical protein
MPPRVKRIVITEIPDVVDNPIFDEPEDTKPIKIAKVRKPRQTKAKIITPIEFEKELEADLPIIHAYANAPVHAHAHAHISLILPLPAITPTTEEIDTKKKHSRNPTQYNILVGEFLKKISIDDKNNNEKLSGSSRLKKAQEMYRQWKIDNPTTTTV